MLIKEIAQYLHARSIGVFDEVGSSGDIYLGILPDTPDRVISIFQRGGQEADPRNEYRTVLVQVITRSFDKHDGMNLGQSVIDVLSGFHGELIPGGTHIIDCIAMQSAPVDIGNDAKGRYEWSVNLTIEYKSEKEG